MKAEMEGKIKYGIGGLICGAIVAMIIGFAWGGWATASTTQKMSDDGGLGEPGGDLRRPIHEGTEQPRKAQRI